MKKDIENRKDIELLVNTFYEKVKKDTQISHFFSQVIIVNWEEHLSIMYNFWENLLFFTGNYVGNPILKHKALHEKYHLSELDFKRWLYLFLETIDELFEGEQANLIKQKAISIAYIIQTKIIN